MKRYEIRGHKRWEKKWRRGVTMIGVVDAKNAKEALKRARNRYRGWTVTNATLEK